MKKFYDVQFEYESKGVYEGWEIPDGITDNYLGDYMELVDDENDNPDYWALEFMRDQAAEGLNAGEWCEIEDNHVVLYDENDEVIGAYHLHGCTEVDPETGLPIDED